MVPLATEPSRILWFASDSAGTVDDEAAIAGFLAKLRTFTNELEEYGCAVAVTPEMAREFWTHVAAVSRRAGRLGHEMRFYYEQKYKGKQLLLYVRSASKETTEGVRLRDAAGELQHALLQQGVYAEWKAVLGLIATGKLPPVIIQGQTVSIFRQRELRIEASMQVCNVCVETSVAGAVCASVELARSVLAHRVGMERQAPGEVVVRSTGGHSSVWGAPIRRLTDIPDTHGARSLLEEVIRLVGVTEVTFLDFYKSSSASSIPAIRIRRVVTGDTGDVLEGTLYTVGKKQNCQNVALRVPRGLGELCKLAFPRGITLQDLEDAKMKVLSHVHQTPA